MINMIFRIDYSPTFAIAALVGTSLTNTFSFPYVTAEFHKSIYL